MKTKSATRFEGIEFGKNEGSEKLSLEFAKYLENCGFKYIPVSNGRGMYRLKIGATAKSGYIRIVEMMNNKIKLRYRPRGIDVIFTGKIRKVFLDFFIDYCLNMQSSKSTNEAINLYISDMIQKYGDHRNVE